MGEAERRDERRCEADSSVRTCLPFWFTSKYLPEGLL